MTDEVSIGALEAVCRVASMEEEKHFVNFIDLVLLESGQNLTEVLVVT